MNALTFRNTTFDIVDRNNQPWLKASQIAEALGYNRADRISEVYARHSEEFTTEMTDTLKLRVSGNLETDTRIFSPRGCYALGMFARTKVAKDFRVWVLDVLEGKAAAPVLPVQSLTKSQIGQLFDVVAKRSGADGQLRHYMWGRLKEHFGPYASYHDIPAGQFDAAMQFVASVVLPAAPALPNPHGIPEGMVLVPQYHVDRLVNYAELARKYWANLVPAIKASIGYELSGSLFDCNECTKMAIYHMEQLVSDSTREKLTNIRRESRHPMLAN